MVLKIVSIVLKILEIVVLLAGTGVIGYFVKEYHDDLTKSDPQYDPRDLGRLGRYEFYLYSTSLGVIIGIISLAAVITGLVEKKGGTLAMVAVHVLWALQLLVSTALLAKMLTTFEKDVEQRSGAKKSLCDDLDELETDYQCSHVIGGVACGFIAAILFFVDTIVYTIWCKRSPAQ